MANLSVSNPNNFSQSFLDSVNGSAKAKAADDSPEGLQNRFLTMLIAQLKNQDPTNPMDASQTVAQLAQLSTVSGISQLNSTLSSVITQLNSAQSANAAQLVGKGVLIPGNGIGVGSFTEADGTKKTTATPFGFELSADADNVTIQIKDSTGNVVRTVNAGAMDAGSQALTWDAKDDAGNIVADGKYTISVTATAGRADLKPTALTYAQVQSVVASKTGEPLLNVGTGTNITLGDVRQYL